MRSYLCHPLFHHNCGCVYSSLNSGFCITPSIIRESSGPTTGLVLSKERAVAAWRALIGPANSKRAKEEHPKSIRAMFGIDGQKNAVHGSDSVSSCAREAQLIMSVEVISVEPPAPEADRIAQKTLMIVKPPASSSPATVQAILRRIHLASWVTSSNTRPGSASATPTGSHPGTLRTLNQEDAIFLSRLIHGDDAKPETLDKELRQLTLAPVLMIEIHGDRVIRGAFDMVGSGKVETGLPVAPDW